MELQTADAAARCGATDAPDGAGRQVFPDCGQRLDPCGAALMSGDGPRPVPFDIEVRLSRTSPVSGKSSIHLALGGQGSLTISNILVKEEKGKLQVTLPLLRMGGCFHPAVTLQGELKQQAEEAIREQYRGSVYTWSGAGKK